MIRIEHLTKRFDTVDAVKDVYRLMRAGLR